MLKFARSKLNSFHKNEAGGISIASVFTIFLFAVLMGQVINSGRQIDSKIRMQNAADAAAYSGTVVLARSMNTLAYTNHLLTDVFGLTAYMREARDRNSQSFTPDILAAWDTIGPVFQESDFPKFEILGGAIVQKTPLEQDLVDRFSDWASEMSLLTLPTLETILSEQLIPNYQRTLVASTAFLAQEAAGETARRHAERATGKDKQRGQLYGVLWHSFGQALNASDSEEWRCIPVVDAELDTDARQAEYFAAARSQRRYMSDRYLNRWNDITLVAFDEYAKMSQFNNLWRGFTRGYLDQLLDIEYFGTNLPMVIRGTVPDADRDNRREEMSGPMMLDEQFELQRDYMFVAVSYWKKMVETMPGVFTSPMDNDQQAFAQAMLFVPRRRLITVWTGGGGGGGGPGPRSIGGVPGGVITQNPDPPLPRPDNDTDNNDPREQIVVRQSSPDEWDLFNQYWLVKLVPARAEGIPEILQTYPGTGGIGDPAQGNIKLPRMNGLTSETMKSINNH